MCVGGGGGGGAGERAGVFLCSPEIGIFPCSQKAKS